MIYSFIVASACLLAQSLIDHILVLSALYNEINSYAVLDSSLNFSDHCIISFNICTRDNLVCHRVETIVDDNAFKSTVPSYVWNAMGIVNTEKLASSQLYNCISRACLRVIFPCCQNNRRHAINKCVFCVFYSMHLCELIYKVRLFLCA